MKRLMRWAAICGLALCATGACANPPDLNAMLCDPAGWQFNKRYVSISQQERYVRGNGPGLLFEYTRAPGHLFKANGKFNTAAYRPTARKDLPNLDLSGYNRLSFWVYVEGNAGEAFQWGFAGVRFRLSCRRGEWFRARWDFVKDAGTDLKKVARFVMRGVNQGSPPGDAKRAKIYLSNFVLEKVADETHEGWAPAPGEMILPYTGFYPGETVVALVAAGHAGKAYAYAGKGERKAGRVSGVKRTDRAEYAEIRIVAPGREGDYVLAVERGPSATFQVREHPYQEVVGKALRAIRAMRCGCATELHGPCHLDDAVRADTGKPVDLCGGWHDEGVSQYAHLTVRTTGNLAKLRRSHARKYRLGLNEDVDDDLLEEVEWGVRSILKYELEPGVHYRALVAPYWFHTDNQPGTGDERTVTTFHPHQLSCWWRTEAMALGASVCREPLKSRARAAAERCWALHEQVDTLYTPKEQARWQRDGKKLRVNAARLAASVELFRLTGDGKYAKDAAETANHILTFQETRPSGEGGLVGYFYAKHGSRAPYTGVGCKSLDVPGRAMAELLMTLPDHPDAPKWRNALKLYVEGTLKPLARFNAPYGCVAAGPYRKPITALFPGERRGDMILYPLHVVSRTQREKEILRCVTGRSQPNLAAQMAAIGTALDDDELIRMAHAAIRYLLGANQFHLSLMRHFGARSPEHAQLPNVPGMMVGRLGITSEGRPFFDLHGAARVDGPSRFHVKEGNTAMVGYLLEACSYLETAGRRP